MTALKPTIIFLGTPAFAVPSLEALVHAGYNVVAVVTAPDQPAGRGQHLSSSAVKQCAVKHNLPVLQPTNLKDENFLQEVAALRPQLMIVVAFRMMPRQLWQLPPLGTFNLHASLLPQYRGAAPINHAIINGETETGITTFFLKHEIDTGNILLQQKIPVGENTTAGQLHDILMQQGAALVLQTTEQILQGTAKEISQRDAVAKNAILKPAPKIYKEFCKINWSRTTAAIHNLVRGLSPYPAAFTLLQSPDGETIQAKIFNTKKDYSHKQKSGSITTDSKTFINIAASDGALSIHEMQLPGKKRLSVSEILRGFQITNSWKAL